MGRKRAIGNIHTGATPPWLRDEDEEEEVAEGVAIGPSLEEFLKHSELVTDSLCNDFSHALALSCYRRDAEQS